MSEFRRQLYRLTASDLAIGYQCDTGHGAATIAYIHRPDSPPLHLCDACGSVVHQKTGNPLPSEQKAKPHSRSSGVLQVTCPHCEAVNEFSDLTQIEMFMCVKCGEPVEVEECADVERSQRDIPMSAHLLGQLHAEQHPPFP